MIVIQRQLPQKGIQFFKAIPDVRWVGFVGFLVRPEELVQDSFAIQASGIKGAGLQRVFLFWE